MYSLVRSQRATAAALQNVSGVNRESSRLAAASIVCDSTKYNGLVTVIAPLFPLFIKHRVAGQPFKIPLMYNPILWNNFLIKKLTLLLNSPTFRNIDCQ